MSREQFIQNTKPLVAEPPSPTWGEAMNCGAFPTFEQNQGGGVTPTPPKVAWNQYVSTVSYKKNLRHLRPYSPLGLKP